MKPTEKQRELACAIWHGIDGPDDDTQNLVTRGRIEQALADEYERGVRDAIGRVSGGKIVMDGAMDSVGNVKHHERKAIRARILALLGEGHR